MRVPEDPYPDVLARVVNALLANDSEAGRRILDEVPFVPTTKRTERWPAVSVMAKIFARDCYHCRYCGERVILIQIMRLIAPLFPVEFPYHLKSSWPASP